MARMSLKGDLLDWTGRRKSRRRILMAFGERVMRLRTP